MSIKFLSKVNSEDNIKASFGDSDDLQIYHNGSKSFVENSTGDLEITQNADDADIIIKCDDDSGGTTQYMRFDGSSPAIVISKNLRAIDNVRIDVGGATDGRFFHDGTDTHLRTITGDLIIDNTNDDGDIIFKTDNGSGGTTNYLVLNGDSTHAYFSNPGNVGIGTTSPSRALQVIGTDGVAKFYYNSSFTNAQYSVVDIGMMTSGTAADGFGPKITFRMGGNGYDGYTAGTIGTIRNGADNTHNLNFATSNGGSMTTKMTITNAGDVGIGTASPSEKLDVNGTVNLTNLKIATAQGSDGQVLTSTGSGIAWEDVSGGLPTTGGTMTGDLKFNDNVYARFGSTGTGDLIIGHTDFGSPYSVILDNGSGDLKIQASNLLLESANGETYVDCNFNGSVDLYYNNSKKFETTSAGVSTTGDSIITGDVGIGTTSPSAKLHVNGQNGLIVGDGNETGLSINNGTYIYKIGDIDGGENQSFIEIDSASQKTIFNNTNVGIGTTSPSSLIEMSATLDNTDSKLLRLTRSNQGSSPAKAVGFYSNSGERGSITVSNFATAYNTSSDYRLKENVVNITNGINKVKQLEPKRFNFIGSTQVVDGFLAHEAQTVVPEAVEGEKDAVDSNGNAVYQGIDQAKLVPILTAALKEAITKIEQLETRIQTLENNG